MTHATGFIFVREEITSLLRDVWRELAGSVPSLDHCVGTQKLLGEWFGQALCEQVPTSRHVSVAELTRLSVMVRCLVVLQDWLDDLHGTKSGRQIVSDARTFLSHVIRRDYCEWDPVLAFAFDRSLSTAVRGVARSASGNLWRGILEKNCLVYLPLTFVKRGYGWTDLDRFKNFTMCYLWWLQLVDDLEDYELDYKCPRSHNVYASPSAHVPASALVAASERIRSGAAGPLGDLGPTTNAFLEQTLYWVEAVREAIQKELACRKGTIPPMDVPLNQLPAAHGLARVTAIHRKMGRAVALET